MSFVLMVFVGCQGQVSCGVNKNLNLDKGKEFITSSLENKYGVKATSVDCPGPVKGEKDGTFQCTVLFGTAKGTVNLVQTDDKGTARITSVEGLIFATGLEKRMAEHFGKQLNLHVEVACGERIRPSIPGSKFTCDARDAKGATGKILVTVDDDKANVTFKLAPRDGAPPPEAPPAP